LPFTDKPYQKASWTVEGAKSFKVEKLGDQVECVRVTPNGTDTFQLVAKVQLVPYSYEAKVRSAKQTEAPESFRRYLAASLACDFEEPRVKALVTKLKGKTPYSTVRNVLKWCQANLHFVPPGKEGGGKASEIIRRGYAHCEGETTVAVTLLRGCGIPARFIRGHGAFVGDSGHGSHHTITEFYIAGEGWIPWDYDCEPFVVSAGFLYLWVYESPIAVANSGDRSTMDLWNIQGLGGNCEFVDFKIIRRWAP